MVFSKGPKNKFQNSHGKRAISVRATECQKKFCIYYCIQLVSFKASVVDVLQVESLLEEIRTAFIDNLPSVSWMDDETRDYATQKAGAVTKMLGYPDFIMDPVKLDEYYEKVRTL